MPPLQRRRPAGDGGRDGWPAAARTAAGGDGAAQPGYRNAFRARDDEDDGWSSWWTRATPEPPRPDPHPEPNGNTPQPSPEPNGNTPPDPIPLPEPRPPADDGPQLRRRVPQANLAAGLRRDGEPEAKDDTPVVRDPMTARNALSRFQAAQRAARDAVDGDRPDGGAGG
jgi:hypothetical protein